MLMLLGDAKVVLKHLLRLANETSTATVKLHTALQPKNKETRETATPESELQIFRDLSFVFSHFPALGEGHAYSPLLSSEAEP